jgi:hypothetical protein
MKSLVNKLIAGLAGLAVATTLPLAASAQTWHDNDHRYDHRPPVRHETVVRTERRYPVAYGHPGYRAPYANGYYGWAPAGYQGYFWNGRWYHHRRMNAGIWIYF